MHRPIWRDEFLQDLPALEKYSAEMRAWQRQAADWFERADVALWSLLDAGQACLVFNQTLEFLDLLDATGELEKVRLAENEERARDGVPPLSERDCRTRIAREYAQWLILNLFAVGQA